MGLQEVTVPNPATGDPITIMRPKSLYNKIGPKDENKRSLHGITSCTHLIKVDDVTSYIVRHKKMETTSKSGDELVKTLLQPIISKWHLA